MDASTLPDVPDALFDDFSRVSTDDWMAKIRDDLRGTDPESVLVWESIEGVTLQAVYRADDRDALPHMRHVPLADPTASPANRWRIRQDVAHSDLGAAQHRVQQALDGGATDLGIDLCLEGDLVHGVPIHRQRDLDVLLQDVDLTTTPIHCAGGPAALPLWAMLCNVAAERGIARSALSGSTDFDPMAALARHQMSGADRAFDAAAEAFRFAADLPSVRPLSVDLRPYHAAGASAVQELALALGACTELLVRLQEHGVAPQQVADAMQWVVPVGTSFFIGMAKLRALRLLIPQVLAPFGVETAPTAPFIQAVTSRREATTYDPHVNLLRGTTAAAAAVIGGCDVLTVRPFTAAAEPPNDFAQRMARNTQLILREEAHLDKVADPAAGAYYIEAVTDALARAAWSQFQDLERAGGLLDALQSGSAQRQIAEVRTKRMQQVTHRDRVLVGTNHYPSPPERPQDREASSSPAERIAREGRTVHDDEARSMTALRELLADGAPLGDVLPAFTGEGAPPFDALPSIRLAAPFEALRRRTEAWADRHDGPPRVVLLPIGDPAMRSARANFARNVFGVAGFAIDEPLGFDSAEAAAQTAADAEADVVVMCSADDAYSMLVPAISDALQTRGADPIVVVAGAVPDQREMLEAAGADAFIHRDMPLLDALETFQQRLGLRSDTTKRRDDES